MDLPRISASDACSFARSIDEAVSNSQGFYRWMRGGSLVQPLLLHHPLGLYRSREAPPLRIRIARTRASLPREYAPARHPS